MGKFLSRVKCLFGPDREEVLERMRKVRNKANGVKVKWELNRLTVFPTRRIVGGSPEEYDSPIKMGLCVPPMRRSYPLQAPDTSLLPRADGVADREIGEMPNRVWELCRLLKNAKRLELLAMLYRQEDAATGYMVGEALNEASLNQPATSEYLKDLERIGLLKRERRGRFTNCSADYSRAEPAVRDFASILRHQLTNGSYDMGFASYLPPLSNAFRARAIHLIASEGQMTTDELCDRFHKKRWALIRDLEPAVKGTLLDTDDEEDPSVYTYTPPFDPLAQRLVELVR